MATANELRMLLATTKMLPVRPPESLHLTALAARQVLEGTVISVAASFIWGFYVIIKTPDALLIREKARRKTQKKRANR